jgi:hypothetical protein
MVLAPEEEESSMARPISTRVHGVLDDVTAGALLAAPRLLGWNDRVRQLLTYGESAGNVARDAAQKAGLPVIDIALRDEEVANCSLTSYRFDPALGRRGMLTLELFNYVVPLQEAGEKGTKEPDAKGVTG